MIKVLLSIIIPCYKEEKDIAAKVAVLQSYLNDRKIDAEIICVSDGSPDRTFEIIQQIEGIVGIGYPVNAGKGGAVKYGIEHASGDYCLFMDADLSTDLEAISKMLPLFGEYDMIIGSRHHPESVIPIKQPLKRRIIGWLCRKIVNMKFKMHYTDTQCGFKAIKTPIARKIVEKQIITGFAFDVEYLYIARLNDCSVKELPVVWRDDRGSTVSPLKSSIAFFKDLGRIKKNKDHYYFNGAKE